MLKLMDENKFTTLFTTIVCSIMCLSGPMLETNGPRREEICLRRFANNTDADKPAHPRSLISAFVILLLKSIIFRLTAGEISMFYLISVADEICFSLALSETRKTGFVTTRPNYEPVLVETTRWPVHIIYK